VFEREGGVWMNGSRHALCITKTFRIDPPDAELSVEYILENREARPLEMRFGVELVAGGMAGNAPDRYYLIDGKKPSESVLQSQGTDTGVKRFGVRDEWMGVTVEYELDKAASLWRFPIETVSLSESGFERLYQGSVMIPHWNVTLGARGSGDTERWVVRIKASAAHR
jgi:4-alpha-glucanotransferase